MLTRIFSRVVDILIILSIIIPSSLWAGVCWVEPIYTFVPSAGIGNIAVRIECPTSPRYPEGAPVVVEVSTWFVSFVEFHRVNDTRRIGAVTVSYLWPGRLDAKTGIKSDGEYDYGGPLSLSALKDVIRFASGLTPDVNGKYIGDISIVPVLIENVGLFASSHSGVVATNVLAYYGNEIPSVKYLVGRENPTLDEMYPLELGYFNGSPAKQNRVSNPFFKEEIYLSDTLNVDYSTVGWYKPQGEQFGRPYFAARDTIPQHILAHDKTPKAYDKRYYSRNITHALLDNGALTLENWPDYLATPSETDAFWPYRITVHNYADIVSNLADLKVMLVFSRYDHVQAAVTKPHIHQAWDGFYHTCGFWVRMNPDRAYTQSINPDYGQAFPDNRANREPVDWIHIEDWGFPTDSRVRGDIWLVSMAEMADRVYMDNWNDNLDSVFFPVLISSENNIREDMVSPINTPEDYSMLPNFPNPFNPETTIPVKLSHQDNVCLIIYNLQGELIETLFKGKLWAGNHFFQWSVSDLPTGIYICRFKFSQGTITQKLIFLK